MQTQRQTDTAENITYLHMRVVKITLVDLITGVPIAVVDDMEIAIVGKGWDLFETKFPE